MRRAALLFGLTLAAFASTVTAPAENTWKEGENYFLIEPAQPTNAPAGKVEVVVYGKGKEPLVHTALEKSASGSKEMPIELTGRKNDDKSGTLTLLLPGNYQADIVLVKAE